jgi:hypothetical protein
MASPYTGGSEPDKLYNYAVAKGNGDKAARIFAEHARGRGLYDVSGGTAVPKAGLPAHSAAHSSAAR